MLKTIQKVLIVSVLISATLTALADGVGGKKNKNTLSLNITKNSSLRGSISYNLKTGLVYKGSLTTPNLFSKSLSSNNTIVSYQKGNMIYVLPIKQKVIVPEMQQGYTGMKLVIRPH